MKRISLYIVMFVISCFWVQPSFASSYVLPYPSTMPGGLSYKIHVVWEKVLQYWYFGNLSQFDYNLKESDKYLVEAKTLFEYQQYLLGFKALQKSDVYFQKTLPYLFAAQHDGKDISDKRQLLHEAAQKHIEVLQKVQQETPLIVNWQPEKQQGSVLKIGKEIEKSLLLRKKYL